ncbi:hypothetical protein BDR26DRAFT_849687 [Obelidium mucronatum]|nr:hypothetical protein BDR26DRAFT_849687 [Obelidium mucronatum]
MFARALRRQRLAGCGAAPSAKPKTPLTPHRKLVPLKQKTDAARLRQEATSLDALLKMDAPSSGVSLEALLAQDPIVAERKQRTENINLATIRPSLLPKLLRSCTYALNFKGADECIKTMDLRNIPQTPDTLNNLIQMFISSGDMEAAEGILTKIFPKYGVKPNIHTYEKLIVGYLELWRPRRPTSEDIGRNIFALPYSTLSGNMGSLTVEPVDTTINAPTSFGDPSAFTSGNRSNNHDQAGNSNDTGASSNFTEEIRIEELELKGIMRSQELFQEIVKMGVSPNVAIFDVFMRSHYRRGDFDRVLELFETMKQEKIKPDRRIYTVVIETVAVGMRNLHHARFFLQEMTQAGIEVDIYISTILMNAYLQIGDTDNAKRIFSQILESKTLTPTILTYGSLINTLCRSGQMKEAHFLVSHEIPRLFSIRANHVMYNTLIHGYGMKGDLEAACVVLDEMAKLKMKPLITTFSILMSCHVQQKDYKGAWRWYQALLSSKKEPTLVTYNILINMHLKEGDPTSAQEIYQTMIGKGIIPDTATFAPMIEYYSQMGNWSAVVGVIESSRAVGSLGGAKFSGKARGRVPYSETVPHNIILERMRRNGNMAGVLRRFLEITTPTQEDQRGKSANNSKKELVTPDSKTYDILIRALGSVRDFKAARFWLDDAIQKNIADTRVFNTMMMSYLNSGLLEEAKDVYGMIEECGLTPNAVSVTLLFKANDSIAKESDNILPK